MDVVGSNPALTISLVYGKRTFICGENMESLLHVWGAIAVCSGES